MLAFVVLAPAQEPSAEAPPSADALLALPRVECRSGRIVWRRTADARTWVLSNDGQDLLVGHGPDVHAVDRAVTGPAARGALPGAPWRWTERIRIVPPPGITEDAGGMRLDATFTCTDTSDPASRWVDVDRWFTGAYAERPGPGVRRCRGGTPEVVWVTTRRMAGIRPRPGDVLSTTTLAVDGVAVGGTRVLEPGEPPRVAGDPAEGPPELPAVIADSVKSVPLKSADPNHRRTRETFVFTREDNGDLWPGTPRLEATLTCDGYSYPPMP